MKIVINPSKKLQELSDEVKLKRNKLLQASDWTQLPDAPVDKLAWQVYRQKLRDIPKQPDYPVKVDWPETP
jgi:hypothetical protein